MRVESERKRKGGVRKMGNGEGRKVQILEKETEEGRLKTKKSGNGKK